MSMRALITTVLVAGVATFLFQPTAIAEDWRQFRGANANGVVDGVQLPLEWGPDKHVIWKVRLPGIGWSQPVVWGDKIFVTTAEADAQAKPDRNNRGPGFGGSGFANLFSGFSLEPPQDSYRWKVLCLDAGTGEILWDRVAREGRPTMRIHANNTYASETPVTDGERLIAYFGMTGVYCYDLDGNQIWKKDLGVFPTQFGWGTGSSPLLYDDLVFIQCDNDEQSFLVALDKRTGDEVWRAERDEKSNWPTPYLWKNQFRTELVTAGGSQMRSYHPTTGKLLWSLTGSGRTAITPIGDKDLLFVDSYDRLSGTRGVLAAIRPGASGDISSSKESIDAHIAWSEQLNGTRIASPLLMEGNVYVLAHSGIIHCLDAKSGKEHYRKRVPGAAGFVASPLANAGKLYCVDENCTTVVIDQGPELQVVATNSLNEMCWASPAVAGNHLLLRTVDQLYCIGEKE